MNNINNPTIFGLNLKDLGAHRIGKGVTEKQILVGN
jgi:hypothetical protein